MSAAEWHWKNEEKLECLFYHSYRYFFSWNERLLSKTYFFALQAEKDRELAARVKESLEHEAEVMKHNDGWTVGQSVYSNKWSYPRLWTWNIYCTLYLCFYILFS